MEVVDYRVEWTQLKYLGHNTHTHTHTHTHVCTHKATQYKGRVTNNGNMPGSSNIHLIGGLERESKHNGDEETIRHLKECSQTWKTILMVTSIYILLTYSRHK